MIFAGRWPLRQVGPLADSGGSMHARRFEVADCRLHAPPRRGHFQVPGSLADFGVTSRFAHGFATMYEDDLACEIDNVLHVRLPSFAVVEGTIAGKCDDSLCEVYFLGIPIL